MPMKPFQIQFLTGEVFLSEPQIVRIRFVVAMDLAAAEVLALEAVGDVSGCTGYRILDLDGRPLARASVGTILSR